MRIILPGDPVAKARPKFTIRGKHTIAYDPQDRLKNKAKTDLMIKRDEWLFVNQHLISSFNASYSGPKEVNLHFYMPIALSDSRAVRNQKLWGCILPDGKPDFDNLAKFFCDVANGILWHDDSQIVTAHVYEKFSNKPCTIIEVKDIKITMSDNVQKVTKQFSPDEIADLEMDFELFLNSWTEYQQSDEEHKEYYFEQVCQELVRLSKTYAPKLTKLAKDAK